MELLLERKQKKYGFYGRMAFQLHAKVELDEEEGLLVSRYQMYDTVLINIPTPGLLRRTLVWSFVIALIIFACIASGLHYELEIYVRISVITNIILSLVSGTLFGMIYYHNKRETIYVKDLVIGRFFTCPSVIALARTEAYLQTITMYFRQVVESAKHWGGTETFSIEPLPPEEAKRTILSGPFLE